MNGQAAERQALLLLLPSVDALLKTPESILLQEEHGRSQVVNSLRAVLEESRDSIQKGEVSQTPSAVDFVRQAATRLEKTLSTTLYPLLNASGVIIHTNLGRAPLSKAALSAIQEISAGYSNLEYDTQAGKRGSRSGHAAEFLRSITGAEEALVVNNNAAAVLLMLTALCRDREVIISRGQLVEIGGGFRIPDVMAQSGARLVEVGTTNRTHLHDYRQAVTADTAAILVAHHSNYQIVGFTSEPDLRDLAELARENNIPLLVDQGSGALIDVTQFGLQHEPTVIDCLHAGVDLVAFSGDKLLGGPQAGILCGKSNLISIVKKHPLARAVRADKTCYAALSATLLHYLRDEALEQIPVWQMIARSTQDIKAEADDWVNRLQEAGITAQAVDGRSRVGGGSLPGSSLPTTLVAITSEDAEGLGQRLRTADCPVISRIQDNRLLLDPRTILPSQAEDLLSIVIKESSQND